MNRNSGIIKYLKKIVLHKKSVAPTTKLKRVT